MHNNWCSGEVMLKNSFHFLLPDRMWEWKGWVALSRSHCDSPQIPPSIQFVWRSAQSTPLRVIFFCYSQLNETCREWLIKKYTINNSPFIVSFRFVCWNTHTHTHWMDMPVAQLTYTVLHTEHTHFLYMRVVQTSQTYIWHPLYCSWQVR